MATGLNAEFVREWWEVSRAKVGIGVTREAAMALGLKWFPYASGGGFRKWYGNLSEVVNWERDGERLQSEMTPDGSRVRAVNLNLDFVFREGISWTSITSGRLSVRLLPSGSLFSSASNALFADSGKLPEILGVVNSSVGVELMTYLNPTLNANPGDIGRIPFIDLGARAVEIVLRLIDIARRDHDSFETSWDFSQLLPVGPRAHSIPLRKIVSEYENAWGRASMEAASLEDELNEIVGKQLGIETVSFEAGIEDVSLANNPAFAFKRLAESERVAAWSTSLTEQLVSYAVGCMFGRYSLDESGLILANQGATLQDYLAKVPSSTFVPDADNAIPIVDGDWFEDDIVERFRQFLRVAFGEQNFEDNLRFVTESLGVKSLRDYFVRSFYKDHVQRYKKRPIYWLFSSPKGSFNALIYMHRYTPSTVSTVLTYLREYVTKLESALQQAERVGNAKEADRLRKVLVELNEYEHDTLFPKASENVVIDLDDGVKANYPKFGAALKKIPVRL